MKINYANDGTISVEIAAGDDESKAIRIITAVRSATQQGIIHAPATPRPVKRRRRKIESLNATQYSMWSYLVDNDCENGIHYTSAAAHFGLGGHTAGQRLSRLARSGLAYRVRQGWYRAEVSA
jgi:hypothetical protein